MSLISNVPTTTPFYSFSSPESPSKVHNYLVQEPLGKRPFPPEFELDMEYAPRAKRRFDKISAGLESFSISKDLPPEQRGIMDSSSEDDEMDDLSMSPPMDQDEASSSDPVVLEPDDEPLNSKKIRLDESLQKYLQKTKSDPYHFLPKPKKLEGNEITLWQPTILISPKNDFNMTGRITEINDEEEEKVNEEKKNRYIETDGMIDEDDFGIAAGVDNCGIVELDNSDDSISDIGSSWNSPTSSQIVEIEEETRNVDTPSSLTNGSVSDEEMMEFDD